MGIDFKILLSMKFIINESWFNVFHEKICLKLKLKFFKMYNFNSLLYF